MVLTKGCWQSLALTASIGVPVLHASYLYIGAARPKKAPHCGTSWSVERPPFEHATSQESRYLVEAWAPTLKKNLEPLFRPQVFGCPRWRKGWVQISSELERGASTWDVVNSIGSAHLGWTPPQMQVSGIRVCNPCVVNLTVLIPYLKYIYSLTFPCREAPWITYARVQPIFLKIYLSYC